MSTELFSFGYYVLHSGAHTDFKINCEVLGFPEIKALAWQARQLLPAYRAAVGIPTGGLALAKELDFFKVPTADVTLIVDDVVTTGASFEQFRREIKGPTIGFAIFNRGNCPDWVTTLFTMNQPKTSGVSDDQLSLTSLG